MRVRPQSNRPASVPGRAFSLIELLISLALIIILFVVMFGFSSRSHQQEQKRVCQKNLQTIHVALEIFANDHEGAFPVKAAETSEAVLSQFVPKYTAAQKGSLCCTRLRSC